MPEPGPLSLLADDESVEPFEVPDLSGHHVVAVLVCHDGLEWLPTALAALRDQTVRPRHVVAVDTGSADGTAELLAEARADGTVTQVVTLPRDTGFAAAVDAGADAAPARPAGWVETADWLWVLHDDAAAEPEALEALLAAGHTQPSLGVVGPKVIGWDDPRRLLEVGVSISSSGRRDTGLERHEQDQGQHDSQRDVLAVGSAGALVRRDVWDALGGYDRRLTLFREDVDLGWRAHAAGHRVAVVPQAVVRHAEATARGRRPVESGHPHRADRSSALYVVLANTSAGWALLTWVRLLLVQLLRAAGYMIGKSPVEASDELAAASSVLLRTGSVRDGRRARAGTRTVPRRHFRELFPARGHQLRLAAEWVGGLLATGTAPESAAATVETGPVDDDGADFGGVATGVWRRRLAQPWVLLGGGLLVLALLAWRGLYRGGPLHGGALLPVPDAASDLWHAYLATWHPVGQGSGAAASSSLAVVAVLALPLLGHASWVVTGLLMLAVPLAALTAWVALRPLDLSVRLRLFAAVAFALSPSLLSAVAQGRTGTALAAVLLPLVALAAWRASGRPGTPGSVRAAAAGALLLAAVLATAPVLWPPVLALTALAMPVLDRGGRRRVAAMALLPFVLLEPWSLRWLTAPSHLLLEAGVPLDRSTDAPWTVLLLDPGGPVAVPVGLSAGLLIAAVAATWRVAAVPAVRAGLVVAGVGLLWALVLATVTVTPEWTSRPAVPWAGPALIVATGGLLVAVVSAARASRGRLAGRALSWHQPAVAAVTVLALLVPVAAGFWWLARGSVGPIDRSDPDPLPAFVQAQSDKADRVRTLVLVPDDGHLGYSVLRSRPAAFGDEEQLPDAAATARLTSLVAAVASGRGGVSVDELARYAVQYVLVPAPGDPDLEATLDAVPGLVRVANPGGQSLWRLEGATGRLQLRPLDDPTDVTVLSSGEVSADTDVPPSSARRSLLVAETSDAGWRARLDGQALSRTTLDDWAVGFPVDAGYGSLVLEHRSPLHTGALLLQGLLVVVVVVGSLPSRRRDEEVVL